MIVILTRVLDTSHLYEDGSSASIAVLLKLSQIVGNSREGEARKMKGEGGEELGCSGWIDISYTAPEIESYYSQGIVFSMLMKS